MVCAFSSEHVDFQCQNITSARTVRLVITRASHAANPMRVSRLTSNRSDRRNSY